MVVRLFFPTIRRWTGTFLNGERLVVLRPVVLNERRVGTLYLQTSLEGMYDRLRFFIGLGVIVLIGSALVAYALSAWLQKPISQPIHTLTETARRIAADKDFTVRVLSRSRDEAGQLTNAFNQLLAASRNGTRRCGRPTNPCVERWRSAREPRNRVQLQLERLELLHRITRAIGERQDLQSVFQVVLRTVGGTPAGRFLLHLHLRRGQQRAECHAGRPEE